MIIIDNTFKLNIPTRLISILGGNKILSEPGKNLKVEYLEKKKNEFHNQNPESSKPNNVCYEMRN